jgi:uncharacterized membrane protein
MRLFRVTPWILEAHMTTTTDAPADILIAEHPPERLRLIHRWRAVAVLCSVGLIVLGLAWELRLAPLPGGSGGALALKVLPLTFVLGGLVTHRMRSYRALSLLIWLYFTEGVMRGVTDRGLSQQLAWVEIALSVLLFVACAMYVRLRLKVLPPKDKRATQDAHA